MITRLIDILLIIILGLFGYSPELFGLSIRFEFKDNLKFFIDPVLKYNIEVNPNYFAGGAIGDIMVFNTGCDIDLAIEHEHNHVLQYQALGDYFKIAKPLNLEGYPYYPDLTCNSYMWKPPGDWPFRWGLIEVTVPIQGGS